MATILTDKPRQVKAPPAPTQKTTPDCYHCGEPCAQQVIEHEEHAFCCTGCQTVYDILKDGQLGGYYKLQQRTGLKGGQLQGTAYDYLDQEAVAAQLLDFKDEYLARVTFYVPGIHCSSCIWLLEKLPKLHGGIQWAGVQFVKKELSVSYHPDKIGLKELAQLLAQLGYAPEINLASPNKRKAAGQGRQKRSLLLKIGVAGFVFGNTMLLSLPAYLDVKALIAPEFTRFFGYVNLLLALPVFFYSARDYFVTAWQGLRKGFISMDVPIALGILTLMLRSTLEVVYGWGHGYFDSLAGLVFFLLLGKWYQHKTYQALSFNRDYKSYFPMAATVPTDQGPENVLLKDVKPGMVLLIRHGELIPADATLNQGQGLIDYSFVTGEAAPVNKVPGQELFAGGRQQGQAIEVTVTKAVDQSYLTSLWNQQGMAPAEGAAMGLTPLVARVGQYFTIVVLLLALGTALYWAWANPAMIWQSVSAVLIVACPCALALAVPFAFGHTMRLASKLGAYFKNADVTEQLVKVKAVVFDKTGTLTMGRAAQPRWHGAALSPTHKGWLLAVVNNSTHPLSVALRQHLQEQHNGPLPAVTQYKEVAGQGLSAVVAGQSLHLGRPAWAHSTAVAPNQQQTAVYVSLNGQPLGHFSFENHYRPGFENLMQQLRQEERPLHLLSGDNDSEAERLAPYFDQLRFKQSPQDKMDFISQLKDKEQTPMMVGDGLNDAGALQQSHVGVALADNVHQFSPACHVILKAERLPKLHTLLHFSAWSYKVVKWAFALSFAYNAFGLAFAMAGLLTPLVSAILMPLSSVTVVLFTTLMVQWGFKRLNRRRA